MKKLSYLLLAFVTLSLTSCFDIFESITLKEDGSGVYEQKLDMGKAFQLVEKMGSGGAASSKKKKEYKDSSFSYAAFVDTAKALSAEQKAVFRKGSAIIHIDEAKGEGLVTMRFPFANAKEFTMLQDMLHNKSENSSLLESIGNIIAGGLDKSGAGGMMPPKDKKDEGLPTQNLLYSLTSSNVSCKVLASKTAKPKEDMSYMPKEFLEMMQMNTQLTINLPRAAKNVVNKNAVVSADKKTVSIKKVLGFDEAPTNLDFGFSIDY